MNDATRFVERTAELGLQPLGDVDVAITDIDGDGRQDLVQLGRRRLRVSTSRQAMRIATPISTCRVMIERSIRSATSLSISTPRFIGPGCITSASGRASASRSSVRP